ncbi:MAG: hypothetical protein F6K30_06635 [Cyanothece sp. SIO2G6]|nr:hypothetical protein [Cyanothece sp. SIO2G6]
MPKILNGQAIELATEPVCMTVHEAVHERSCVSTGEVTSEPDRPVPGSQPSWTLQELTDRYGYSTRNTQHMIAAVLEAYPDRPLKRKNGRKSIFSPECVELLDSLHTAKESGIGSPQWVAAQKEKSSPALSSFSSNSEPFTSDAGSPSGASALARVGVVPSHIPLATDEQHSILDNAIAHLSPATVDLNGQQESNLAGIERLLTVVDQATAINDQKASELAHRMNTVEKSEQVLDLLQERLQNEQKRSKTLNATAAEIAEREQQVSDRLGKFI